MSDRMIFFKVLLKPSAIENCNETILIVIFPCIWINMHVTVNLNKPLMQI